MIPGPTELPWPVVQALNHYVLPTLSALELALRDLGRKAEPGAGVAAAQRAFADAV
jgi:aspartate aminotransferase-like enzyme